MKRLGQHFLINQETLFKIAKALELKNGETVVEIGPGHGELTQVIGDRLKVVGGGKFIAIERDERLAGELKKNFPNVEVITGDVLKILPDLIYNLSPKTYYLVGNIPYYITGYLLRIIGDLPRRPVLSVLTVQREVAERLVSGPPDMNQLAASVQFWGAPEIIGHLSPTDFRPAPKVRSSIIKIVLKKPARTKKSADVYYRALKILFRQPRKTVLNNVVVASEQIVGKSAILKAQISANLRKLGINPLDRPQNLTVNDIVKVSGLLGDKL